MLDLIMDKIKHDAVYNAIFILGLPDNKEVKVIGYDPSGQLILSWDGNADFHNNVKEPDIINSHISIVWFAEPTRQVKKPDIVINCINDADICGNSLKKATEMITQIKSKWPETIVFNQPEKVLETSRDRIYQLYKHLPGIYIPKALKITPNSADEVLQLAKDNQIDFPFLMRPSGSHQSDGLQRIDSIEDAAKKLELYAYDGRSFYITEFVDYQSPDGLYYKSRLTIMNGKINSRHHMMGPEWMVSGTVRDKLMAFSDSMKASEENFVKNYRSMINQESLDTLLEIYNLSGLDYLGFDFAIMPDKSLLIFEINPAQNCFLKPNVEIFPYMGQVQDILVAELNSSIREKLDSLKKSSAA